MSRYSGYGPGNWWKMVEGGGRRGGRIDHVRRILKLLAIQNAVCGTFTRVLCWEAERFRAACVEKQK